MSATLRVLNRGLRIPAVKVGGGFLLLVALMAIVLPLVSPNTYLQTDFNNILRGPSLSGMHLFGTDDLGRDLFVRTMMGIRVTLLVAVVASIVSLVIGVLYGATAGYVGGRT
ncbi:MAG: peptide ABC transporter permease, partial [Gammaproteobacteria bacterium]|nr:peptide ABC transporter permease [Gammaproteobacteria bacterium]